MSYYLRFLKEFLPTPGNHFSVFVGTQTTNNVTTTNNYGSGVFITAASVAALAATPCFSQAYESIRESAGKLYSKLKPANLDFGDSEIVMRCGNGVKLVVKFDVSVCDSVRVNCIGNQGTETAMKVNCDMIVVACLANTVYSKDKTAYSQITGPKDTPGVPERIDAIRFGYKWLCVLQVSGRVLVVVHSLPSLYLIANVPDTPAKAKKLDFCKQIK